MNYKQILVDANDTQKLLKKNGVTLVPGPAGSPKNDVLIQYRFLPEIFERVFNNCLVLEGNPDRSDKDIIKYHICVDYIRGVLSAEDYTLFCDDDLHISYSMGIAARHMQKIGINPQKVCEDAKDEIIRANAEYYTANLDTGDKVILSRGVILKAMRDGSIPDFTYLIDEHAQGNIIKFEFYNYKNRTEYLGYLLKEGRNDRQAIDFALMQNGGKFFEQYLEDNDIDKIGKKNTKLIMDEMFIMDDLDEETVPTLKFI